MSCKPQTVLQILPCRSVPSLLCSAYSDVLGTQGGSSTCPLPSTCLHPRAGSSFFPHPLPHPAPFLSKSQCFPRTLAEAALRIHCASLHNPLALTCCPQTLLAASLEGTGLAQPGAPAVSRWGNTCQSGGWKSDEQTSSPPDLSQAILRGSPQGSFRDPSQTERPLSTGVTSLVTHLINFPILPVILFQLPGLTSRLNYLHPTPCLM